MARLDYVCEIYRALSAGRSASRSPALRFTLGKANRLKKKLVQMALNRLQEQRDIKIMQYKHKASHFYLNYYLHTALRAIFEEFSNIVF